MCTNKNTLTHTHALAYLQFVRFWWKSASTISQCRLTVNMRLSARQLDQGHLQK